MGIIAAHCCLCLKVEIMGFVRVLSEKSFVQKDLDNGYYNVAIIGLNKSG